MLQQALQKLNAEISSADKKHKYIPVVGGFLINHVRNNPDHANLIMAEGKTLAGSVQAMAAEAKKIAFQGCGVLTDEDGFNIVLRYFGIDVPKKEPEPVAVGLNINVDDML